jgi:hypothetical protein
MFTGGGLVGAVMTLREGRWALAFPTLAILAASTYAFSSNRCSAAGQAAITRRST